MLSLLVLLTMATAAANEGTSDNTGANESAKGKQGVVPGSVLYKLQTAIDRINLALTFDKAAKAEKGLRIAQKRLLQVEAMAERGKPDKAERAEKDYEWALSAAAKAAGEIESKDNSTIKALERIARLQNITESHYEKMVEVKEEILRRQNTTMTPEQIAHLQDVFSKIEEKAKEMQFKLDTKREKVMLKQKARANMTNENIDELNEEINEKTGLAKGRQERAQKQIEQAKQSIAKAKEKANKLEAEGRNISQLKELIEEAERQVGNLTNKSNNKTAQFRAEEISNFGREISAIATTLREAKKEGNFSERLDQMKERIQERRNERLENESQNGSQRSNRAEAAQEAFGNVRGRSGKMED